MDFSPAPYPVVVQWWAQQVKGTAVALYIGEAAYKVGHSTQSTGWGRPEELSLHVGYTQRVPEVKGHIYYRMREIRNDPLGAISRLVTDHYL
jgi:uncharacterized lipoprotein YddW (UPF0748 family)